MHFPLVASIVLAGAALIALMEEDELESGVKWYFGGSIAAAMLSLAIIGALHKTLDRKGSALIDVRSSLV